MLHGPAAVALEFSGAPAEESAANAAAMSQDGKTSKRIDFDFSCEAGQHAMRMAARVRALELRCREARGARRESEVLCEADVDAMSRPK